MKLTNPIYFDRMIAKGNLKYLLLTIFGLPFLVWAIGAVFQDYFFGVTTDFKNCLLLETYENFINFNQDTNSGISHRLYALFVGILGVFLLNGILVSAIVSWVEKRSERWKQGELYYNEKRWFHPQYALNHYVIIIGGNEMVPELIRQIISDDSSLQVLVMTNRDVASLRKKIASKLGPSEERVVIYSGDRIHKEDLIRLQIERADRIYVIGEQLDIEQKGCHHDVKSMECIKLMSEILRENAEYIDAVNAEENKREKLMCRVMFEYQSSFSVFQFTDVDSQISSVLDFRPFNYYETWAQNVLICPSLDVEKVHPKYLPLEGKTPITANCDDTVHLIIVGMSRMGVAMGMEAAHIAHYPNFVKNPTTNRRTRITFIDSVAKKEMQYLQGHYKELFAVSRWRYLEACDDSIYYNETGHIPYDSDDASWHDPLSDENSHSPYKDIEGYTLGIGLVDVDWEFIQGNLEMPSVQCYIRDAAMKNNIRLTIAICFPQDNASFAASLYLPDEVYDEKNNVVQVLAYQPYGDAMCHCFKDVLEMTGNSALHHQLNFNQLAKLKAFGMMDSCYNIRKQQKMEKAANLLWEQYDKTYSGRIGGRNELRKAFCKEVSLKTGKSLAAKQWSNTYAAAHLWTKLRNIKWNGESEFDDETQKILAELEHIRWNMEQLLLGFAPLRPEEQIAIKNKLTIAKESNIPNNEILQLQKDNNTILNKKQYPKLDEWLDAWEEYDKSREILKANMSHIDICSFEVLKEIDEEAIKYDEDLTRILPSIYQHTIALDD